MTRRWLAPVSALAAALLAAAAGLVLALLVHGRLPDGSAVAPVAVGAVAAAVVGIAAAPAFREGLRAVVPGLRRAPAEASRRIAEAAAQRLPTDELLLRAAEALRTGLDSPRVELWVRTANDRLVRTATLGVTTPPPEFGPADVVAAGRAGIAGEGWARRWLPQLLAPVDPGDARRAPLRIAAVTDSGELLGLVVVGRPPGAPGYDRSEDDALGSAVRILAAVLRNRALTVALEASLADLQHTNAELAASRRRVVTAGDAERRRIERDLHDGAQQHLLALAVTVGLVRQMVAEGDAPGEILETLDQLAADVRTTVGELRALAQGIYPALLIDAGLVPALRAAAGRSAQPVTVEDATTSRCPAELEAALYFCCLEALQNAAKHAPAATVRITVRQQPGRLLVEVADDGPGFDPAAPSTGLGRTSMADRVGAHGGTVRWTSTPGAGTTVHLDVPLP
jgi:signal transduction histidine kinase